MMEKQQGSASENLGYYASKISGLLSETVTVINLKDSKVDDIILQYSLKENNLDSSSAFLFLSEAGCTEKSVCAELSLKYLDRSVKKCIKEGEFISRALKDTIKQLKLDYLSKFKDSDWILFQDLFRCSNSVIFKGENPVLVIPEAYTRPFYLISSKPDVKDACPKIFLDFDTDAEIASVYPEPKDEIFGSDEAIKVAFYISGRDDEIVMELVRAKGCAFSVKNLSREPDYMKTKSALSVYYNDSGKILSEIVASRLSSDALGILDLII